MACAPVDSTPLVEYGQHLQSEFENVTVPLPPAEDLAWWAAAQRLNKL